MKIERTMNASRNIIFGILLRVYQVFTPFLMRSAMIYFMGIKFLGLNSLFQSVLQVLNLAELGVGSAMVFSMYKPIAEDDSTTICALMRLYKTYYYVIGGIIAVVGVLMAPIIPMLITGDIPEDVNIYILYFLNLGATVLTYWLFAYKNSLLQAHQRNDVVSKVNLVTSSLQYGLQFLVVILLKNYYLYVIILLLTQSLTNVLTAIAATKLFPTYHPKGKLSKKSTKEINTRIKDLFTSKVGGIIVNSADTIVISAFLGLASLAIYQNYFFILTSITGFIEIIFQACIAGLGNSLIVETKEKYFNDFKKFSFITFWLSGWCSCCLLCLYQPFMQIWVGKDLMLDFSVVICLCMYFFIYEINRLFNTYKDAGGIWHQDRFRPLVTAIANLCMNLIMVQFWGIYGVILSTVLSTLFVGMPWIIHNLFTTIFEKEQLLDYLKKIIFYVSISFGTCLISLFICSYINWGKWVTLIIRLIICGIVPNMIFIAAYHGSPEFKGCVLLVNNITKGKINNRRFTK